ncbi:MAG: ZIP family metal transporter [Oscillospiraceae bacterium]|nr:ZIP family metal transporter [Oscillospiraceae bacterium]
MPFWVMALLATLGTWSITALGAAVVLFFRKPKDRVLNAMLGFAAGVMLAASVWSLLEPAMAQAALLFRGPAWLMAAAGLLCGAVFLWGSDLLLLRFLRKEKSTRAARMLVLSITLHNIPEGLAVGVAFGALAADPSKQVLLGAISVAVGIGMQNFPEGAAVSLPLQREGFSRKRSFFWGQLSGAVEPVAGLLGALLSGWVRLTLPFLLSFAAGAMLLVCARELIPACHMGGEKRPYLPTAAVLVGFALMMAMDNAL